MAALLIGLSKRCASHWAPSGGGVMVRFRAHPGRGVLSWLRVIVRPQGFSAAPRRRVAAVPEYRAPTVAAARRNDCGAVLFASAAASLVAHEYAWSCRRHSRFRLVRASLQLLLGSGGWSLRPRVLFGLGRRRSARDAPRRTGGAGLPRRARHRFCRSLGFRMALRALSGVYPR